MKPFPVILFINDVVKVGSNILACAWNSEAGFVLETAYENPVSPVKRVYRHASTKSCPSFSGDQLKS